MQSKLSRFSNSRIPVTRQVPANSNIMPKGTVVGASPKEQQIQAAKAELAKSAGPSKFMPASGTAASSLGDKKLSPEQAAYAAQGKGVAPDIGPTTPPRAPTAAETAQLTRAASSSAPQMDYVPGPGGTKMPISGGNRGVTPLPTPGLIGMPQPTPEAIAAGRAIDARKGAMNPPGSYTPPAGINMPGMRASAPPRTPQQMMKKGGQAKAYASGGSVKGAGIAQRGVRKCKMV